MKTWKMPPAIAELFEVDENDLAGEFRRFSAHYSYWLWNRSQQQKRVLEADAVLDRAKNAARNRTRRADPDLRVDDLKELVALDPDVLDAVDAYNNAVAEEKMVAAVVEALKRKSDMLISLGAQQRALMGPGAWKGGEAADAGLDLRDP